MPKTTLEQARRVREMRREGASYAAIDAAMGWASAKGSRAWRLCNDAAYLQRLVSGGARWLPDSDQRAQWREKVRKEREARKADPAKMLKYLRRPGTKSMYKPATLQAKVEAALALLKAKDGV